VRINLLLYKNLNYLFLNEVLPISITFGVYLQDLLEGANMKNIVLPIAIFFVWIPVYIIISSIEIYFSTEIIKENNLNSTLIRKNIYKTLIYKSLENIVIATLIFSLMGICLISELSKDSDDGDSVGFTYLTILSFYVFFCLGSIILKGIKIGESFEKIEGPKDEFFNLIGAFFLIFKKWFFDKTTNSFNIIPKNNESLNNKEDEAGN